MSEHFYLVTVKVDNDARTVRGTVRLPSGGTAEDLCLAILGDVAQLPGITVQTILAYHHEPLELRHA